MKKVLLFITALFGLFTMVLTVLLLVNGVKPVVTIPAQYETPIEYITNYVPLAALSAFVLFYFSGKGFLRILLTIIVLLVIAVGVIAIFFPDLILKVLA